MWTSVIPEADGLYWARNRATRELEVVRVQNVGILRFVLVHRMMTVNEPDKQFDLYGPKIEPIAPPVESDA